eukprot:3898488-Amphidinium_carterae.1
MATSASEEQTFTVEDTLSGSNLIESVANYVGLPHEPVSLHGCLWCCADLSYAYQFLLSERRCVQANLPTR